MPQAARRGPARFFQQPKAVWATAFACVVGFMSIGLVDPILVSISKGLNAGPAEVSLLFTSYFAVTAFMMLVTGYVSSRIGTRGTLLLGAALIVIFAGLSGTSNSIVQLVMYRAGWGLGNALFVATSLAVIVGAASGGSMTAILLYEAALGLGISLGPLLGALLGGYSWRYPFFGVSVLMAIGFIAIAFLLDTQPKAKSTIGFLDPLRALRDRGLSVTAISAFFYNYAFFAVLAFAPFVLRMSPNAIGLIFFAWGSLLAFFSVIVAPRLQQEFNSVSLAGFCLGLLAVDLVVIAFGNPTVVTVAVILSGAIMGTGSTLYTEMALEVSDVPRAVASAGYNFVRWFAGVIAPYAAPKIAEFTNPSVTFMCSAVAALIAMTIILGNRKKLGRFGGAGAVLVPAPETAVAS